MNMTYKVGWRIALYKPFVRAFLLCCVCRVFQLGSFLLSFCTITTLINQTRKSNEYCLLRESLLTDRAVLAKSLIDCHPMK